MLKIVFNVDPFWTNNLIQIAGSPLCTIASGQTYTITNNASTSYAGVGGLGICSINVSVQDMRMYICKGYVTNASIPRSISVTHYTKGMSLEIFTDRFFERL